MAFIVEMIHRRLNQLEVGPNGKIRKDEDYARLAIGGVRWEQLLLLGECCGWEPIGTVLADEFQSNSLNKHNYEPSSWDNKPYKIFLAQDAELLIKALEKSLSLNEYSQDRIVKTVLPKNLPTSITKSKYEFLCKELSKSLIEKFINFLKKGDFIFVWDD